MGKNMFARDVMDPAPVLLHPDDSIADVARKILARRYRSLAVVDEKNRFLGVVTVSILLKLVLPKAATMSQGLNHLTYVNVTLADLWERFAGVSDDRVGDHMQTNAIKVAPDTPLLEALLLIYKEKTNLPVVNRETGILEGMISYYDIGEHVLQAGYAGAETEVEV